MSDLKARLRAAVETAEVKVPGSDETLRVRGMSGRERSDYVAEFGDLDEGDTGRALDIGVWFATRCVVDENGERVFSDEDTGFVESLPARLLDEIAIAVSRLSGVSEEAVEEGKDGSPETANDAGGSRSPAISGAA